MLISKTASIGIGMLMGLTVAVPAAANDAYPSKPIRIIVTTLPGGIQDVATRLVAKKMEQNLGQPVIIENRPGGGSILGTRLVKDAPADGYTLLGTHNGYSLLPALRKNPEYLPLKDFRGIGPLLMAPFIFDVAGEQPYRNIKEFIAHAKRDPKSISFASPGIGTPNHMATELFFQKTEIKDLMHVPFKGASAAVVEVASGRIPFYVDAYASSAPYLASGKIRGLAVSSAKRIPVLPDVPTLMEQGVDFSYEYWLGILTPRGTPDAVVQRLSEALQFAVNDPELQKRFNSEGGRMPAMSPSEFDSLIEKEVGEAEKLVADLGLEKQ